MGNLFSTVMCNCLINAIAMEKLVESSGPIIRCVIFSSLRPFRFHQFGLDRFVYGTFWLVMKKN